MNSLPKVSIEPKVAIEVEAERIVDLAYTIQAHEGNDPVQVRRDIDGSEVNVLIEQGGDQIMMSDTQFYALIHVLRQMREMPHG